MAKQRLEDIYCTGPELAKDWGVSRQWVQQMIQTGRIPSRLLFGRRIVRRDTKRPRKMKTGPKPKRDQASESSAQAKA